jgi:hypothetical protein
MNYKKTIILITGLAFMLVLTACGQISVGIESVTPVEDTAPDKPDSGKAVDTSHQEDPVSPQEPAEPQEPVSEPQGSQYWVEVQDPHHGFRFAVPCFWRVDFPVAVPNSDMDPARSAYSAFNYPDGYASQFPRGAIPPENGIIKIDFYPVDLGFAQDIPDDISLEDYVAYEVNNSWSPERELVSVEETSINGNKALLVTDYNSKYETSGSYYLLRISPDFLLNIVEVNMSDRYGSEDVQAIINSLTLDPQAAVPLPNQIPGEPPLGVDAACMQ